MRVAIAVFSLIAVTGCGPGTRYEWTSLRGRDCFWSCQNIVNTCSSTCMGPNLAINLICSKVCLNQGKECASSCPDLAMVVAK